MADVYVESWDEFVEAVGVSGDTVILPEEAEWDMGEILPYGLQSNIIISCYAIDGRNTRIKNLNLNARCFQCGNGGKMRISNLLMTDWLGTSQWFDFRFGSDWFRCAISGITSSRNIIQNDNQYQNTPPKFTSCSINVESSAGGFEIDSRGTSTFYYCRVEIHAPNSTSAGLSIYEKVCCELIVYAPNASGNLNIQYIGSGTILRGNLKSVTGLTGSNTKLPSVYSVDTFADDVTSADAKFIPCTEEQLKDATYLRSIGFPIVVG